MRRPCVAPARVLCALAAAMLLALPLAASGAQIAFERDGGDAWTFDKTVGLTVEPGACEEVIVTSPRGAMRAVPEGDRALVTVPLTGGRNLVSAECRADGAGESAPVQEIFTVRLPDVPKARIRIRADAETIVLDAQASEPAPGLPAPIVRYEWRARAGNPEPIAGLPGDAKEIVARVPARDGAYDVRLRVTDARGRADESTARFRVRDRRMQPRTPGADHPAWVERAVVYGVVPRLFGPRGLADVTARLDDLRALGVNTLWLSPVTAAPPGDFGYAVTDYFRVRTEFGTEADLRELVTNAHARDMRVIIDFVPNHLSERHPYYVDAQARAARSAYFDFFARGSDRQATHYFDWTNLKNLNFDNPEVQQFVIAAFAYWVREFDVDGFRVDVAWGPRRRAPEFWPRWREELKRIKPDLLLLAEATARDSYYFWYGFDAAYDWTDTLGQWAWQAAFDDPRRTVPLLRAAIAASPSDHLVFRFLNNNDTRARFVEKFGLARTRVAAAMLLTLPGIPSLYTGDEVGARYQPYAQHDPIDWRDPHGLRPWYRQLIALRGQHAALRSRAITMLETSADDTILSYLRPGDGEAVAVFLNYGSRAARLSLSAKALRVLAARGPLVDLVSGEKIDLRRGLRLPAYGVKLLQVRSAAP